MSLLRSLIDRFLALLAAGLFARKGLKWPDGSAQRDGNCGQT